MRKPALSVAASPLHVDVLDIERGAPDTQRSYRAYGVALVETFVLPLPDGTVGRCWIPTAEAIAIEAFGRGWIASALRERSNRLGAQTVADELRRPAGCRLSATNAAGERFRVAA